MFVSSVSPGVAQQPWVRLRTRGNQCRCRRPNINRGGSAGANLLGMRRFKQVLLFCTQGNEGGIFLSLTHGRDPDASAAAPCHPPQQVLKASGGAQHDEARREFEKQVAVLRVYIILRKQHARTRRECASNCNNCHCKPRRRDAVARASLIFCCCSYTWKQYHLVRTWYYQVLSKKG